MSASPTSPNDLTSERATAPPAAEPGVDDDALIALVDVRVVTDGRTILGPLSWRIEPDHHWVVLGPNGGGKSTLVAVASLARHPSSGRVHLLGHELGRVDLRSLRARVGVSSPALTDQLRGRLTATEVVMCGLNAALEPWWHHYDEADANRAGELLAQVGLEGYGDRTLATLSSGERQRTLLARTLMAEPDVVLLDEPTAGLDLAGREGLVTALDTIAASSGPATVFVTHHVEDIPPSTTHLLALVDGRPLASGPIDEVLSADLLQQLFGLPVTLERRRGRWSARAENDPPS